MRKPRGKGVGVRTDKIGAPAAWVWRDWGKNEKRARTANQNRQAGTMKGFEVKKRRSRVSLTCKREVVEMTAPEYTCPREASLNRSRTPGGLAHSPSIASPTPASWHKPESTLFEPPSPGLLA